MCRSTRVNFKRLGELASILITSIADRDRPQCRRRTGPSRSPKWRSSVDLAALDQMRYGGLERVLAFSTATSALFPQRPLAHRERCNRTSRRHLLFTDGLNSLPLVDVYLLGRTGGILEESGISAPVRIRIDSEGEGTYLAASTFQISSAYCATALSEENLPIAAEQRTGEDEAISNSSALGQRCSSVEAPMMAMPIIRT